MHTQIPTPTHTQTYTHAHRIALYSLDFGRYNLIFMHEQWRRQDGKRVQIYNKFINEGLKVKSRFQTILPA